MQWIGPSRFKALARKGAATSNLHIRKALPSTMEAGAGRVIRFTISTPAVDRDDDSIAQAGWKLDAYLKNPVVLFNHLAGELPIGRCIDVGLDGDALKASVEFVPADMPVAGPLAEAVCRMAREGFLSATSVGFRPLEWEIAKDRDDGKTWFPPINYRSQELMEWSICTIPCNPEALIDPGQALPSPADAAPPAPDLAEKEAVQRAARHAQRRNIALMAYR